MDDPSALDPSRRMRRLFKLLLCATVFPLALYTILALAYMLAY
jgi:hypothetical protein